MSPLLFLDAWHKLVMHKYDGGSKGAKALGAFSDIAISGQVNIQGFICVGFPSR